MLNNILSKLINLGGVRKFLYCDKCDKYTEHISIPLEEYLAKESEGTDKTLDQLLGVLNNFNPGSTLINGIPYICLKCETVEFHGGIFSDNLNQEKIQKNNPEISRCIKRNIANGNITKVSIKIFEK